VRIEVGGKFQLVALLLSAAGIEGNGGAPKIDRPQANKLGRARPRPALTGLNTINMPVALSPIAGFRAA
jgi:hypothetical protein